MAENEAKKSFILYHDLINVVEKLIKRDRAEGTNDTGELFNQILEYVNGVDEPPVNFLVEMAFEPIKQQLGRDFDKWEVTRQKRIEAGRKGGEKSGETRREKQIEANEASASINEANEASASNASPVSEEGAGANIADDSPKVRTAYAYGDDGSDMPF